METESCETSEVPHSLENRLTNGGEVVSLTRRPHFTPQEQSSYIFRVSPRVILRLNGLVNLRKKNRDFIVIRSRDSSICNIAPKPITLPPAPQLKILNEIFAYLIDGGEIRGQGNKAVHCNLFHIFT
jgi:hypothetical protein